MLTEADKAWLACAVDGEGCIFIRRGSAKKNSGRHYPVVGVYNTEISFVTFARNLLIKQFGSAPVVREHCNYSGSKLQARRICYQIEITGTRCCGILEIILPYLIIKAEKAREMIRYRDSIEERNSRYLVKDKLGRWVYNSRDEMGRYKKKIIPSPEMPNHDNVEIIAK
jgi:hypothetical protein